ncbi:MAG TPA: NAD(P)-dependent oxidoreductase [Gammaproteobacteria bacterium]|nr:NAD(P)-dependent oxidoreductase [Gammaproteobacteria bacterium]
MKIAVSGATGFVGQHIITELEKRSITPILLIRPSSIPLLSNRKYSIVSMDLCCLPKGDLFEYIGKPDILIHCAWAGLPNYNSRHHFENELPIQYKFLTRLIKDGLHNLLVTGTCFEYGMQAGALHEGIIPQPNNPYGLAKNTLFQQLKCFQLYHPFNLTWARLFYLYGEGQAKSSLLSQLKQAVANREHAFNMSGGEQLRDYLPISKAAEYLVSLALLKQNYDIINICSGVPISIRTMVENWILANNWDIKLNLGYYPYQDYEPMAFWGERKKLDNCLCLNRGG